jgi:hypothetical protein
VTGGNLDSKIFKKMRKKGIWVLMLIVELAKIGVCNKIKNMLHIAVFWNLFIDIRCKYR